MATCKYNIQPIRINIMVLNFVIVKEANSVNSIVPVDCNKYIMEEPHSEFCHDPRLYVTKVEKLVWPCGL
jgi:hypothetical protein